MIPLFRALTLLHVSIAIAGFALWYHNAPSAIYCQAETLALPPGANVSPSPSAELGAAPPPTEARVWYAPLPSRDMPQ